MTYRLKGHIVDGKYVEVDHRLHHGVVQVAPSVRYTHPLEVGVVGVQHEGAGSKTSKGWAKRHICISIQLQDG